MAKNRSPDQLIAENIDRQESPRDYKDTHGNAGAKVRVTYSSYNRLVFEVQNSNDGYFWLAYPYSGNWTTLINGKKTEAYRANGLDHATWIHRGKNEIEFR